MVEKISEIIIKKIKKYREVIHLDDLPTICQLVKNTINHTNNIKYLRVITLHTFLQLKIHLYLHNIN